MVYFPLFTHRHYINWWSNQNQGFVNEELYKKVQNAKDALEKLGIESKPKIAISTKTIDPWKIINGK